MHVRLLGNAHDAVGFGLAGVESEACRTRGEVVAALAAARADPDVAILVVSPSVAALAGDEIGVMRESPGLPITIVLP